jgi:hypothetical protein
MRGKINRCLYKHHPAAPDFVLLEVQEVGQATENLLQEWWQKVQDDQAISPHWAPDDLNILRDIHLSLPNNKSYLSQVFRGNYSQSSSHTFQAKHPFRFRDTCDFRT